MAKTEEEIVLIENATGDKSYFIHRNEGGTLSVAAYWTSIHDWLDYPNIENISKFQMMLGDIIHIDER